VRLYLGLLGCGISIALSLRSGLGVSPWDVLGQGMAKALGVTFGTATVLISVAVLLLWIPLRQRPGLGTLSNGVLVGWFVDLTLAAIHVPEVQPFWQPFVQTALLASGVVLFAFSCALYIAADLKPGPRDGLMTGLVALTGRPVWLVRTLIEFSAASIGWILGGTVGIGTVVFALATGPLIQLALHLLSVELPAKSLSSRFNPIAQGERHLPRSLSAAWRRITHRVRNSVL